MYSDKVLEMFKNPQNAYKMDNPSAVGRSATCGGGDVLDLFLRIENDVITEASFLTFGCAAAIVSGSVATGMLKGKTLAEAAKVTNAAVIEEIGGLPPTKVHCSVLVEEVIRAALANYANKKH
ncbi:MAG: iron-sulfur cluster assembly scaffold protein [Firmicutes bacterium]|nr:iron-sulfur cluster assembly scaffold protein [Bacillota bacterium]